MTIAHISDTHLGFRAYSRTTAQGFNQREADVMRTFQHCLNAMAERDPDLVIHSGDLFHVVRPSNATIHYTFKALSEFQAKRKGKPFVLIGGNHDTPRLADSGNILSLFAEIPGVEVRTKLADTIDFPELDLEVLCVPSNSILTDEKVDWTPQLKRKTSVLTMHGIANQALKQAGRFDIEDTYPHRWTYVALGDFHIHQVFGKNVCYPGSTDFTSNNIWEESPLPKGWVWFDTKTSELEFVKVATRKVIDLRPISASDHTPEALAASIMENAVWKDEDQPIVRQRVLNVHPDIRGRMGAGVVRDLNARCLNYLLRLLPPELPTEDSESIRTEAITLEHSWEDHITHADLPGGVERAFVKDLGLDLLKEVVERASDPAQA
ncbi:MAG: repair protein SbcD/Mre11 [Fimbriimonadaceae bacterium]|nr:repair protein SbcD/Mre11 [Fimbriimonadaceae bacterium]